MHTQTLHSITPDFRLSFYPSITLDKKKYNELALISQDMYHSIPNVSEDNNVFEYEYKDEFFKFYLSNGSYEIESINDYTKKYLLTRNHIVSDRNTLFEQRANISTLKCIFEFKDLDTRICIDVGNSMEVLHGYTILSINQIVWEYMKYRKLSIL